ncbi:integral membrane sensor signal transduction histidine kinase [Methylocella silvestris BL2]|uniref:histidine kinase n=1 Tax=Methylocella silvestris (strain DSM 15510 / CIP 108128 / LMG 27833 / NCIMB 13906 / BL2) TaxID=395965 RepID=B8ENZ6_METSB|nr:sensor histidine kinase [Methylocella silvestris]ACK49234.1 integral membrane sensor signal transduction histidine kinase [Methylocella silvestris BL2]
MTLELQQDVEFERKRDAAVRAKRMRRSISARMRGLLRAVGSRFSSSLTRRIVVLNLGGLVALLVGFLYLNQFREGLIDARVQSLQTQAEIIAAAVAASATADNESITIDPEKLLQLAPGESYGLSEDTAPSLEFSINPERVGPVLRRLASPTRTRARIYDRDGYLLLDSRSLASRANILRFDLPPPSASDEASFFERLWGKVKSMIWRSDLPTYGENGVDNGKVYPEVTHALGGGVQSIARLNAKGETIVSVAAPIQRFHTVRGAVLLSTEGGDIDKIIASERWAIVRIFLVSAIIMFLLSLFIAGAIAEPIRHLAEAAERVRRGTKLRREIPDFTDRADEIGHLSGALRDMTQALYNRIEAIESFAADVAHELKNPLTSLRSAVETLPNVKKPESQARLLAVIQHDVKRLDRLISDISDASRLDAELARADMDIVDLEKVMNTVTTVANQVKAESNVHISLTVARGCHHDIRKSAFRVLGHDSRLGQVFNNLIDNARSFSCDGGWVRVHMRPAEDCSSDDGQWRDGFEITVDDDGPGIPADAFERIFERFYTDRPCQGFGQNSGLGLSISRQIIEAHGGRISARNRMGSVTEDDDAPVLGARLTIWLPRA